MFREIILPIFRSTRLCVTACGVMQPPRCCRPSAGNIVGVQHSKPFFLTTFKTFFCFFHFFHSCTVHIDTIKSLYLSNWCTIRLLYKNVTVYIKIHSKMLLRVLVLQPSSGSKGSCFAKVIILKESVKIGRHEISSVVSLHVIKSLLVCVCVCVCVCV